MNTKIIENLVDKVMVMWLYGYATLIDMRKQFRYEVLTYKEYRSRRRVLLANERITLLEDTIKQINNSLAGLEAEMVSAGERAVHYKEENDVLH